MGTIYVLLDDKHKVPGAKTFLEKDEKLFEEENKKGFGVYFSVNLFKDRRTTENVTTLRYAYADMDIAKSGDGKTREEKQEAKAKLYAVLMAYLEPTMIIETSNGLQPLWELEDKTATEENKKKYVKILKGISLWGKKYGSAGDNVYDIARILRLPGYLHQKENPFFCETIHKAKNKYTYGQLLDKFPFEEKEYIPKVVDKTCLSLIDREIENIDFQELVIKAFAGAGRTATFDDQRRLVLDGRLTGTFQGKKDDKQFLASTSHEPFKGNKITVVADVLGINNKEARKWIIDEYNINYSSLATKNEVRKQINKIENEPKKELKDKRYTWGTRYLDTHFAIIKSNNFIVVAAKRNSGKTTYTFDMAFKNAVKGHKVLYVSLEMESNDILDDFGRKFAGITVEEEFDRKIPETKIRAYHKKIKELESNKNLIFEGIRRTGDVVWETVLEIINKHKDADMVFLDNLDLVSGHEGENDCTRQKRIVKNIMSFTTSKQIPFVLIHHYRKSNSGADHGMDEISGSAKISDGADRVVKISRTTDCEAGYPENCLSKIYLQKGRGYPEWLASIYFIKGTFVDTPPEGQASDAEVNEVAKMFNGKIIHDN